VVNLRSVDAVFRIVPIAVAACALVSLYAFSQVDDIVNQTMYNYGLQFSLNWANPYWSMAYVLDAMAWLITGLAIAVEAYLFVYRVPSAEASAALAGQSEESCWSTFRLGDGSTIKVKFLVKGARRLDRYSEDGLPVYVVDSEPVVQVVCVPEELKASTR
jgi:hypothetical protein